MTNKDILLGLAARADQMKQEIDAFGRRPEITLSASLEAGIISWYLTSLPQKLIKLSARV